MVLSSAEKAHRRAAKSAAIKERDAQAKSLISNYYAAQRSSPILSLSYSAQREAVRRSKPASVAIAMSIGDTEDTTKAALDLATAKSLVKPSSTSSTDYSAEHDNDLLHQESTEAPETTTEQKDNSVRCTCMAHIWRSSRLGLGAHVCVFDSRVCC
jgi:hypothetical protein